MSRIIAYRRFLEVRLEDDAGAPVEAYEIAPIQVTRAQMARNLLITRPRPSGIALFYRANPEAGPALPGAIASRIRLSFAMRLCEPDFFRRHEPDLTAATGAGLHLDNLDPAGAILGNGAVLTTAAAVSAADGAAMAPLRVPVAVAVGAAPPTAVEARAAIGGAVVASAPVHAAVGATAAALTLDLTGTDGGLFRVAEVPPGPLSRRIYADEAVFAAGAGGAIDLWWETPQTTVPAGTGVVYRVVFERR